MNSFSLVSRLLKQLENLDYVKREESPNDRRAILLTQKLNFICTKQLILII
ncbi:helix-turn-helix domain-containing protein [Paenibacillus sp. FSL R10-2734]|uniref:helix-turn-helix domain-containing protein n=1 Tax=Paenibacillus sp. FSL R10-2734 TaxID=2954691 RepID=UPI0030D6FDB1